MGCAAVVHGKGFVPCRGDGYIRRTCLSAISSALCSTTIKTVLPWFHLISGAIGLAGCKASPVVISKGGVFVLALACCESLFLFNGCSTKVHSIPCTRHKVQVLSSGSIKQRNFFLLQTSHLPSTRFLAQDSTAAHVDFDVFVLS